MANAYRSSASRGGQTGPAGGVEQNSCGNFEALDAAQADVLVLDVDQHVRIDSVQGGEPGGPVDGVVPAAECHKVPGGVLGPFVGPLVATEVGTRLVRPKSAEPVVKDTVNSGSRIDAYVLCGRMEHQRAEVLYHSNRVHPLPEQVRGVKFDADVGCASALDKLADTGRVEDQVLRVQLERHLHVKIGRLAVDLPPELLRDGPLIVEHVECAGVPGVDDPVRPPATGLSRRKARHRHDTMLA